MHCGSYWQYLFFNEYVVHVLHVSNLCIWLITFELHKTYLWEVQRYVANLSYGWGDRFEQHSGFTALKFIDLEHKVIWHEHDR